jgi:hypothetical protein
MMSATAEPGSDTRTPNPRARPDQTVDVGEGEAGVGERARTHSQ